MPRMLEIFAKRGLVPTRWHSGVGGPDSGLTVDMEMAGLAPDSAVRIATQKCAVRGVGLVLSPDKWVA